MDQKVRGPSSKLLVFLPLSDSPPLILSLKGTLLTTSSCWHAFRNTCSDKGYRKAWKSNSTNSKHEAKHTHEREQQKTMQKTPNIDPKSFENSLWVTLDGQEGP